MFKFILNFFIILCDVCTSDIKFGSSYAVGAFRFLGDFRLFGVFEGKFMFVCFSSRDMQSRVGKTWLPCYDLAMIIPLSWRNLVMIKPWWRLGSHVSWLVRQDSWHDHGMIIMFSMFFIPKNGLFFNVFSNNCCHIPLYCTLDRL